MKYDISCHYLLPNGGHVGAVADDEVVEQAGVQRGEGPGDGTAPVVANLV